MRWAVALTARMMILFGRAGQGRTGRMGFVAGGLLDLRERECDTSPYL
jgi:hypothetical protein